MRKVLRGSESIKRPLLRKQFTHPTPEKPSAIGDPDTTGKRDLFFATAILGALYAVGFGVLVAHGLISQATDTIRYVTLFGLMAAISARFRGSRPSADAARTTLRVNRLLALAIAVTFIALCAILATKLDAYPVNSAGYTLFTALVATGAVRFTVEAVVGILVIKRLGATEALIGLGKPSAVIRPIAIIWIGSALGFLGIDIAHHLSTVPADVANTTIQFFRAGFPEELLFRGILLGLLASVVRPAYANLVQALAFGFWHYGIDAELSRGDLATMLALMVCVHATFGYALGLVRLWTRSIAVPSVFHAIADSTDII